MVFSNFQKFPEMSVISWIFKISKPPEIDFQTIFLCDLSRRVDGLEFFLSHSWGTPGYMKYVALLLHFFGSWVVVLATLLSLGTVLFQAFIFELPIYAVHREDDFGLSAEIRLWEFGAGVLAVGLVLAFGPSFSGGTAGFLDVACIHQTDLQKKVAGIKGLAGFIDMSQSLFIMWDPDYFSRGWCCFEVAAYLALKAESEVHIKLFSLELYLTVAYMFLINVVLTAIEILAIPFMPGLFGVYILWSFLAAF